MTTYSAYATLSAEAAAKNLAEALERLEPSGVGAFEIEDGSGRWEVAAYFLEEPDIAALALLSAVHGASDFVISQIADQDWVAQVRRELTPVRAGRFVVYGGHDKHLVSDNAKRLEIEAAMAFGTGHHGTTEGCLLSMDRLVKRDYFPRNVADIGCGTGVLAMAAARVWPARIVATDIDKIAVRTAIANFAANGLRGRALIGEAAGFAHPHLRKEKRFDLILANILARPLMKLAPDAARMAAPGGSIILSGLLDRQAPQVAARYRAWGFAPEHQISRRGWTTLTMRKV